MSSISDRPIEASTYLGVPAYVPERPRSKRVLQAGLECALLSIAMVALNLEIWPDRPAFLGVSPHPTLLIALLIVVRYGLAPGLFGALILAVAHGVSLLLLTDQPTPYHLLEAPYSTPIVLLFPMVVVLGTIVDRLLKGREEAESRRLALEAECVRVKREIQGLRETNVELANKVVGIESTVATLYRFTKQLNASDPEKLYAGVTHLIAEVLRTDLVSVWRVTTPGELELAAREGIFDSALATPPVLGARLEQYFDKHGVLAVHDLPSYLRSESTPFLIGRLTAGPRGRVVAYLTVEKMAFARFGAETLRLFTLIVDWASESLGHALRVQDHQDRTARPAPPPLRNSLSKSRMFGDRRPDSLLKAVEQADAQLNGASEARKRETSAVHRQQTPSTGSPLSDLLVGLNDFVSGEKKRGQ